MSSTLLIRGGILVDGSGAPRRRADVLIEGDRVAAVGEVDPGDDTEVLDRPGAIVAPGFIDVHSHADFTLLAHRGADSAVRQGVTTVVTGNCGGGVAPTSPRWDVRRVAFAYDAAWGIDITWDGFGDYVGHLAGAAINVAPLVPHGAVRNAVMGLSPRGPDASELALMTGLVAEAMDAGAVGLSTGLEYQPGCHAQPDEIWTLARVVAARDGIYATHMRNRAERFAGATQEALDVGRETGVRVQLSHVAPRPYAPPEQVHGAFAAIQEARDDRLDVWVDTFPEIWGPGNLVDLLPSDISEGTPARVARRLGDPGARRAVADAFAGGANFLVRAAGFERIYISAHPVRRELQGQSIVALADAAGQPLADWVCDVLREAGPVLMSVGIRHVYADEPDLRYVLTLPYCSLGSDGVVVAGEGHDSSYPWNASTYGYAARTLEYYVRDVGLFSVEEAVHRLAGLPAAAIGLSDRGVLAPGSIADVVVFDAEEIADRSAPDDMARHPAGVVDVLVNGVPVVAGGVQTAARPGRVVGGRS
jgi:N-acyl-D-amino-acid deacylase